MLKFFSKQMNKKGFTLIELIVVIAILAILALIAIPRMGKFREGANLQSHMTNIRTIEGAINMEYAEKGTFTGINNASLTDNYIEGWPTKPGEYTVVDGVLTASPTKADTQAAIDSNGTTSVTWP